MELRIFVCLYLHCTVTSGFNVERSQSGDVLPDIKTEYDCRKDLFEWKNGQCRCPSDYSTFYINDDQSFGCLSISAIDQGNCDFVYFENLAGETIPLLAYQKDGNEVYYEYKNIVRSPPIAQCLRKAKQYDISELIQDGSWKKQKHLEMNYIHNRNNGGLIIFSSPSSAITNLQGTLLQVEFMCRKQKACFYTKLAGTKNYDITVVITNPIFTTATTTPETTSVESTLSTTISYTTDQTTSSITTVTQQRTDKTTDSNDRFGRKASSDDSSPGTSVAIGSAVAVIFVLIVIVFFCFMYRRRRGKTKKQSPFDNATQQNYQDGEIYEDISDGRYAESTNNYASLNLSDIKPEPYGSLNGLPDVKSRPAMQLPVSSDKLRKNKQFLPNNLVLNRSKESTSAPNQADDNQYEYLPNSEGRYSEPDVKPTDSKYAVPTSPILSPMYFETVPGS